MEIGIGDRFRQFRKSKGFTQGELADAYGCTQSLISAIENGDSQPGLQLLAWLFNNYQLPIGWLITGEEQVALEQGHGYNHETETAYAVSTDLQTMRDVIESVEEHLQGNNQQLAPAKKAELITTLFEMFSEEEDKQVDKKTVAKLIKLAS